MTTATLAYKAVQSKVTSIHLVKIPWKLMYFSATLLCFFMVIWYIFLINQLTNGTYIIKNYNKQIHTITAENKTLENSFAKSGFLGSVEEKTQALNFEKTTHVTYVQILDNSLARAPEDNIK